MLPLFMWTVGRRERQRRGLGGDDASRRLEGIERGPGRKGLREGRERDECRDLVKKGKEAPWAVE